MKKMIVSVLTPTTKKVKAVLKVLVIVSAMYANHVFWDTYKVQWPMLIDVRFQPIITERFMSPLPDEEGTSLAPSPAEDQVEKGVSPTATPTPSPKPAKKAHTFDLVGDVQAAAISSDDDIIAYIRSKDWDDEVAVALAKSENFWNLTKSFDCSRTGRQNKNGTMDHGLWQINDIHIKSGAITLEDANDCFKATDFAYGLYKGRGNTFGAWSAYLNGSYKNHL